MANRSNRRVVSRPGVNADGSGSTFRSPYQPPPSGPDFDGDMSLINPEAYSIVAAGGYMWRVKVPSPHALKALAEISELKSGEQVTAMNTFLQQHMHPEDFRLVVRRLVDPDDPFTAHNYTELYRLAVTVGTARPFRLSSDSPALRSTAGGWFEPSWPLPEWAARYKR